MISIRVCIYQIIHSICIVVFLNMPNNFFSRFFGSTINNHYFVVFI